MRRRFGAIHSDSAEEFIKTAIDCQDKNLVYYNAQKSRPAKIFFKNFDFTECETNTSVDDSEPEMKLPKKVMVLDNENVLAEVQTYCELPQTSVQYSLEFCHKTDSQNTFHFWINNLKNTKFEELLNVYIRNCDHFVYFYSEELDHEFQEFAERLALLKSDYTLYKVSQNSIRSKSCDNLNTFQNTISIISKTVTEALQTITTRISL